MKHVLCLLMGLLFSVGSSAQDNRELMRKVMQDDSDLVDVLAIAEPEVQTAWLIASSAGEAVARIAVMQEQSQSQFTELARSYSRETQTDMWNVSRYDVLIERLAESSLPESSLATLVAPMPEDVQQSVRRLVKGGPEVFAKMNEIRVGFERGFREVIRTYPDSVQRAMTLLRDSPEVLALMNDNMRSTILIGDMYKRDALEVRRALRERNTELIAKKANDVREWQNKIDNDAEAKRELQQSADEFARDEGVIGTSEWAGAQPPGRLRVVSYAYWSGYPWWYSSPVWYPYPLWYHTGYTVVRGRWIWWGTPSWYFLRWHFGLQRRITMCPSLTSVYLDFWVFGPRRFNPWCSWEARHWYRFYTPRFPGDFRTNRIRRIGYLRSFTPGPVIRRRPSDRPIDRRPVPGIVRPVPGIGRPVPGIGRPIVPLQPMTPQRVRPSRAPWTPQAPQNPMSKPSPRRDDVPNRDVIPNRVPRPDRSPVSPPTPPRMPSFKPRPNFSPNPRSAPAPSQVPSSDEKPRRDP